jgi:hypothetical protein
VAADGLRPSRHQASLSQIKNAAGVLLHGPSWPFTVKAFDLDQNRRKNPAVIVNRLSIPVLVKVRKFWSAGPLKEDRLEETFEI